jgi:precorrin-8X/cobalt-precorrin-8 methylmutase
MPTREQAIEVLEANGQTAIANHVRGWRNAEGGTGGWDANLKRLFPAVRALLWPGVAAAAIPSARTSAGSAARTTPAAPKGEVEELRLEDGRAPAFDAYWMIDWSSCSEPTSGADSIWWALLRWERGVARIETKNCPTRSALAKGISARLRGELRDARVLIGFDFPFGYPRGFARALGHRGEATEAWRSIWTHLERDVLDDDRNANNRFAVAAAMNAEVSGSFGPFYGRPVLKDAATTRTLSTKQSGFFEYPLTTLRGPRLARVRETDRRGGTASTPWFVFGGGNSVGGQALVGIPHVSRLRAQHEDARVWPFETGARLPSRAEARVVLAEIYPSLFHTREKTGTDVHDRLQVIATAKAIARHDAAGTLDDLFAAPAPDASVLCEEGWILGAR